MDRFVALSEIWDKQTEEGRWEEVFEKSWGWGVDVSINWKLKWECSDWREGAQLLSFLLALFFFPDKHMGDGVETDLEQKCKWGLHEAASCPLLLEEPGSLPSSQAVVC